MKRWQRRHDGKRSDGGEKCQAGFLKEFQNAGYETKYYIPRDIDLPIIGSMRDVKQYSIDTLIDMLDNGNLSHFFNLCLKFKRQ